MSGPDAVFGYAPGKVILFGEHAAVYGQPAVACTIDRGIRVGVSALRGEVGPVLRAHAPGLPPRTKSGDEPEGPERLRRALDVLVDLYGERVRGLALSVDGAIPTGAGLGSSAALSVALLRGVHQFLGEPPLSTEALVERAFVLERVFHGNPSGVDHTVIARGGCIYFQRGDGAATVVDEVRPARPLRLAIAIAGAHAGTAAAVQALRDRAKRHPDLYAGIYASMGAIAREGRAALESGSFASLGELMDVNQGLLNALGVSTPAIENLCAVARAHGALGAKLSGAGGGGAVIALVEGASDDDAAPIVRAFSQLGVTAFSALITRPDDSSGDKP